MLTNAGLPATIDTAVTPLTAFYRRANIRGDATLNPFVGIMKPAVRCELRDVVSSVLAAAMLDVLPPRIGGYGLSRSTRGYGAARSSDYGRRTSTWRRA